jgi:hypothetical protein
MRLLSFCRHAASIAGLAAALLSPVAGMVVHAAGRDADAGQPVSQAPAPATADFLFRQPRGLLGVAGGWLVASQSGEIFDLVRGELTVGERDFDTAAVRFHVGRSIGPRLDLMAEVGFSRALINSEYRDLVDQDELPIAQTTELTETPVGGSLRFWLVPRGRAVGRFAWVPARVAPYVGLGGGTRRYRFIQFGDFVDFVDQSIFTDTLESSGWAASGHVFAGTSVNVSRPLFIDIEARYVWANTPLAGNFVGFDNIDLNGLQITGGVTFVF